jgi:hypothetical protein
LCGEEGTLIITELDNDGDDDSEGPSRLHAMTCTSNEVRALMAQVSVLKSQNDNLTK